MSELLPSWPAFSSLHIVGSLASKLPSIIPFWLLRQNQYFKAGCLVQGRCGSCIVRLLRRPNHPHCTICIWRSRLVRDTETACNPKLHDAMRSYDRTLHQFLNSHAFNGQDICSMLPLCCLKLVRSPLQANLSQGYQDLQAHDDRV